MASAWYRERLVTKQRRDLALWERHRDYLDAYLKCRPHAEAIVRETIDHRRQVVAAEIERIRHPEYVDGLVGTLGAEPRL